MRRKFLMLLLIVFMPLMSQDFNKIKSINFNDSTDYRNAESEVLECALFLLDTPILEQGDNTIIATAFITKWMEGTPDFMFSISEEATEAFSDNYGYFALYLSALAEYALKNRAKENWQESAESYSLRRILGFYEKNYENLKKNKYLEKKLKSKPATVNV